MNRSTTAIALLITLTACSSSSSDPLPADHDAGGPSGIRAFRLDDVTLLGDGGTSDTDAAIGDDGGLAMAGSEAGSGGQDATGGTGGVEAGAGGGAAGEGGAGGAGGEGGAGGAAGAGGFSHDLFVGDWVLRVNTWSTCNPDPFVCERPPCRHYNFTISADYEIISADTTQIPSLPAFSNWDGDVWVAIKHVPAWVDPITGFDHPAYDTETRLWLVDDNTMRGLQTSTNSSPCTIFELMRGVWQ